MYPEVGLKLRLEMVGVFAELRGVTPSQLDGWSSSAKALSMTFKSNLEMNLQKEQLSWLDY